MNKFGLTTEEASKALSEQGNNALTQPPRETFWDKLWENFKDPIIRILILALLVNVVFVYMGHGDWIETMGIFWPSFWRLLFLLILSTAMKTLSRNCRKKPAVSAARFGVTASRLSCISMISSSVMR